MSTWSDKEVTAIENFAAETETGKITINDVRESLVKLPELKGKTERMLQSKCVSLGVWKKAERVSSVTGRKTTSKKELVSALEALTALKVPTSEKMNKVELENLVQFLVVAGDKPENNTPEGSEE